MTCLTFSAISSIGPTSFASFPYLTLTFQTLLTAVPAAGAGCGGRRERPTRRQPWGGHHQRGTFMHLGCCSGMLVSDVFDLILPVCVKPKNNSFQGGRGIRTTFPSRTKFQYQNPQSVWSLVQCWVRSVRYDATSPASRARGGTVTATTHVEHVPTEWLFGATASSRRPILLCPKRPRRHHTRRVIMYENANAVWATRQRAGERQPSCDRVMVQRWNRDAPAHATLSRCCRRGGRWGSGGRAAIASVHPC